MWRRFPLQLAQALPLPLYSSQRFQKAFPPLPHPFPQCQSWAFVHWQFTETTTHFQCPIWTGTHLSPSLRGKGTFQTPSSTDLPKSFWETHGLSPVLFIFHGLPGKCHQWAQEAGTAHLEATRVWSSTEVPWQWPTIGNNRRRDDICHEDVFQFPSDIQLSTVAFSWSWMLFYTSALCCIKCLSIPSTSKLLQCSASKAEHKFHKINGNKEQIWGDRDAGRNRERCSL